MWKRYLYLSFLDIWDTWWHVEIHSRIESCIGGPIGCQNLFAFSIISQHLGGTGSWNPSKWKIRTHLPGLINTGTMIVDGLAINAKSQDIIDSHGNDLGVMEYFSFNMRRVNLTWLTTAYVSKIDHTWFTQGLVAISEPVLAYCPLDFQG